MKIVSFKAYLIVALCFLIIIPLVSCGQPRVALSPDEFKSKIEENGFTVKEISGEEDIKFELPAIDETYGGVESITTFYLAEKDGYGIGYLKMNSIQNASGLASVVEEEIENTKGNTSVESSISLQNYSKYSLTANNMYSLVSRIDDTIILVNADSSSKDSIVETLKIIGY